MPRSYEWNMRTKCQEKYYLLWQSAWYDAHWRGYLAATEDCDRFNNLNSLRKNILRNSRTTVQSYEDRWEVMDAAQKGFGWRQYWRKGRDTGDLQLYATGLWVVSCLAVLHRLK